MSVYSNIYKKHGLSPTQQEILNQVGKKRVVLEIGSSTGYMTKAFLKNSCIVDVVEKDKLALQRAPAGVRKKFNFSIEDVSINKLLNEDYEFIILADVLEHLIDPESVLSSLNKIASKKAKLIISTPNIACWVIRKELFFKGMFEYQESGILDYTHLHLFTVNSLQNILLKNGWRIKDLMGSITRVPFEGLFSKIPLINSFYFKFIRALLVNRYKNLTFQHVLVVASL